MDKGFAVLEIDPEFKTLIRPLRKDEYLQLEVNLAVDGCREPIITWNNIIVDGHNRYEICNRLHIPYGMICAVATLERIYTKYGYHVLDRTLRLCVGTWEGDIDSLGANVLAGVARMVVAFGDQLRDETFKERVGFMSVRQLSRIAKERGAGSLCYAEAMLVAYNRKCKYTLRMTKLHSGKVAAEDDFVEENEEPLADDPVLEE